MKKGRGLGDWREGESKEWLSVKDRSGDRGTEMSGKGLESWFRNATDSSNKE